MSAIGKIEPRAAGFTLLEMLVVLAVLGLISALAFPAAERAQLGQRFEGDAATLEARLHAARAAAIASSAPRVLEPGKLDGGSRVETPGESIVFYPDGSARGGALVLSAGRRSRRYTIDPGSGEVAVAR